MENPHPHPLPLPPLPDEILIEILTKLPVKSLLRFRCVSKSWRSLISLSYKDLPPAMSGLFYKNYITNTIRSISLQSRTYIPTSSIDASLDFLPPDLDIADCCNGLLLLVTFYFDTLYVCNPATRKWAQIQQPPTPSTQLVLAFDPNKSKHYRIISIPFPFEPFEGEVDDRDFEVFSSETREWTKVQRFVGFIYLGNQRFAFSNGMLYYADAIVEDTFAIYIDQKVCRRIRRPAPAPAPVPSQTTVQHCLGQSGGFLHYALILYDEMLVWVLEDPRSEEYVLKHRNSVQVIVDKMGGGCLLPDRMAFHPDLDVIFLRLEGKLFSYHMISTEVEEICTLDGGATLVAYSPCYLEDLDLLSSFYFLFGVEDLCSSSFCSTRRTCDPHDHNALDCYLKLSFIVTFPNQL